MSDATVSAGRPRVIVGAYAALPAQRSAQEEFYAGLAERNLADGLEIPFRDDLVDPREWLAERIRGRFTGSVLTLIPGTMINVGATGVFGLASPDPDGRKAALDHLERARRTAEDLNQLTGEQSVTALHVHSAPSRIAEAEMFARSLEDIASGSPADGGWTTQLVIEHCDAYSAETAGEKRFLSLHDEIAVATEAGIGMTVNWGRSVVEACDPERASTHIRSLAEAGLLEGLMFSGAGPSANQYGGEWADAHLPLTEDEPTSLLDTAEVERCLALAGQDVRYVGAKIQAPRNATVGERLDMIGHVTDLLH